MSTFEFDWFVCLFVSNTRQNGWADQAQFLKQLIRSKERFMDGQKLQIFPEISFLATFLKKSINLHLMTNSQPWRRTNLPEKLDRDVRRQSWWQRSQHRQQSLPSQEPLKGLLRFINVAPRSPIAFKTSRKTVSTEIDAILLRKF